ncbi:MAG: ChaN family lipoprotein [Cytophagales bacterium]|nr:ChaN family lipoprotein [Cytophagales bacterium]
MTKYLIGALFISLHSWSQNIEAYSIFEGSGKKSNYQKMQKGIKDARIVFFGELHNNAMAHWLKLQLLKSVFATYENITIAMEMFEADDQIVLDEYLQGFIKEKHLINEAKVWNNYATDYRPIIEYAKLNGIRVIASNIPRRYANLVYREGFSALDSLSDRSKAWIAPLPIQFDAELPGYKYMIEQMGGHGGGNPQNIAKAQAIKDATMAHFLIRNLKDTDKIIHYNGSYHSQNREGIVWYVNQSAPSLAVKTIQVVEQKEIKKLDEKNNGLADFVICVPEDMTKTY